MPIATWSADGREVKQNHPLSCKVSYLLVSDFFLLLEKELLNLKKKVWKSLESFNKWHIISGFVRF